MKHKFCIFFTGLILFFGLIVFSFETKAQGENQFNPILFNGRIYSYNPYFIGEGNPFLKDDQFHHGTLFIGNKAYKTLMNFDIETQKVIIYYPYFTKVSLMSIPSDLVDSFYFSKRIFIQNIRDNKVVFLEKIGNRNRYLLIKHQKVAGVNSTPTDLIYSQNIKSFYWWDGEKEIKVKNKKQFLKNFEKSTQKKIKTYWRKNHFKFRKATSIQWQDFVLYINTYLN